MRCHKTPFLTSQQWSCHLEFIFFCSNVRFLASLIASLIFYKKPANSTTLRGVSLNMFIPHQSNMTKYFRYDGSLTTPNCDEAVVWSLFENAIPLSRKQVIIFKILYHLKRGRKYACYCKYCALVQHWDGGTLLEKFGFWETLYFYCAIYLTAALHNAYSDFTFSFSI